MVNFIIGRCGTGKSAYVANAIRREIVDGQRPVVLIVPEQQTVAWETKMASLLPPSANFRLEITNFTRLSNSVFRETGGLADTVVDEGSRELILWRAMLSVWDHLKVYNHCTAGREDKNIPHLLSAVDELKNSGITPEEAEGALSRLLAEREEAADEGGDLLSRFSDAVLVYGAYEAILHEEYIDRGDLMANLAQALGKNRYFSGKAVFIDSFFSLTKAEERILSLILHQAEDVTVTFACPPELVRSVQREVTQLSFDLAVKETQKTKKTAPLQFGEVLEYVKTVASLATRAGKEMHRVDLSENLRHKNAPALARCERYLFDYLTDIPEEKTDGKGVKILRCADPYDEAEACAAIVDSLLREGYHYRDIAVVARDFSTREGVVDRVLRQHGIRCFLSETDRVENLPPVRFVLAALQVAVGGWQRRDLIRLMKTGLTLVGRDYEPEKDGAESILFDEGSLLGVGKSYTEASVDENHIEDPDGDAVSGTAWRTEMEGDVLEIYTETWNIRGRKRYLGEPWSMNPAGYKTKRSQTGEEMLLLANRARQKLAEPLDRFLSVFDGGTATVRQIAERVVLYAEECRVDEALAATAKAYRSMGMADRAEKVLSSWDKVCLILDCMVRILGDTPLDAGRFSGLFYRVAASMDVGSIPTGVDEVILGSAAGVRLDGVKCVIMLGAAEGEFPASVNDGNLFFGQRDKMELEAVGLNIRSPGTAERTAREYFMFYRTAAAPEERLYILSPSPAEDSLSEGARCVYKIMKKGGAEVDGLFSAMPLEEVVFHPATASYLLTRRASGRDRAILSHLAGEEQTTVSEEERVDGAPALLTVNGDGGRMILSQSKIDTFVRCPFQYWSRYQMKLAASPRAEIKAPDIGTFMHAVLEKFFAALPKEKLDNLPLSPAETEEIADEIMEAYISALAREGAAPRDANGKVCPDGRLAYLFLRLKRHLLLFLTALMEELAQSEFKPVAFELPIGIGKEGVKPIVIRRGDTEIVLQGVADRVDLYEDEDGASYVRVVDYKTGSKSFLLRDVEKGLHVQLLIYLLAVQKYGLPGMEHRPMTPAGALYFQVKPATVSHPGQLSPDKARQMAEEKMERSGVLLKDEKILRAMDRELGGLYVKAGLDKDGCVKGTKQSTSLLSLEEFGRLVGDLEDVIGRIGERMLAGEAAAEPMQTGDKSPCEWCESRFVCRRTEG